MGAMTQGLSFIWQRTILFGIFMLLFWHMTLFLINLTPEQYYLYNHLSVACVWTKIWASFLQINVKIPSIHIFWNRRGSENTLEATTRLLQQLLEPGYTTVYTIERIPLLFISFFFFLHLSGSKQPIHMDKLLNLASEPQYNSHFL